MKKFTKHLLSSVLTTVMVISMIVLPSITASAETTDSGNAIEDIPAAHLAYQGDYSKFTEIDEQVADPEAYGGMAACYAFSDKPALAIYRYDAGTLDIGRLGALVYDDLKINEGYHVYKITCTLPSYMTNGAYVFLSADWRPQDPYLGAAMGNFAGQTVDLYLSIKIAGSDAEGYKMYIDRTALATLCSLPTGEEGAANIVMNDATCMADAYQSGSCPACGSTVNVPVPFTMVDHSFTNYVTAEDGSQVAECDFGCGETDVIEPIEPETTEGTEAPDEEPTVTEDKETEPADTNDENMATDNDKQPTVLVLVICGVLILAALIVAVVLIMKAKKKNVN